MPATDYQGSSSPFSSLGRSLLSIRREAAAMPDTSSSSSSSSPLASGGEIDAFQRHVADLLAEIAGAGDDELLSISWVRKLLEAFILCQEEFRVVLFNHRSAAARPPLDRMVGDFFDRSVKALDVCNAIRDGTDQLRRWLKLADISLSSLSASSPVGEGQLRRAKKALFDLSHLMLDEKEASCGPLSRRHRSFGRTGGSASSSGATHFRSLSWSVSRTWSAARQLQAIGATLAPPRSHEVVSTHGVAVPVYSMGCVLLFTMWALVAAIPCQDRGLQTHFSVPRTFPWAPPLLAVHERIAEESKRKDRRNSCGLLRELHVMERCVHRLAEAIDAAVAAPADDNQATEVTDAAKELAAVCASMKDGLEPLERQVREVFHRIVRSRTEGLDCLAHNPE